VPYADALPTLGVDPDGLLQGNPFGRPVAGTAWESMIADRPEPGGVITFGAIVCVREPTVVTITDVQPLRDVGSGIERAGVLLRDVPRGGDTTAFAAGFPTWQIWSLAW
jgi:hypothetical protein